MEPVVAEPVQKVVEIIRFKPVGNDEEVEVIDLITEAETDDLSLTKIEPAVSTASPVLPTEAVTFKIIQSTNAAPNTFNAVQQLPTTTIAATAEEGSGTTVASPVVISVEAVPPTIGADPVFQEIINTAVEADVAKRGSLSGYNPSSQIYAHKYKDKYSNWYYYRRGY